GSTVQTSGSTPNNFTNPVTYTVTALNASTATYVVTVTLSSSVSSMSMARAYHTATAYGTGANLGDHVLVAGGLSGGIIRPDAEIYTTSSNSWTTVASMITARSHHTATLLTNGKVLVVGGKGGDGNSTNLAEIYDPAGNTWTATGNLTDARMDHTAVLLDDGRVLVAGGTKYDGITSTTLASAEIFDPAGNSGAGSWSVTGSMHQARASHAATALANGTHKAFVAGGYDTTYVGDAEVWSGGTWTTVSNLMSYGRWAPTATLLTTGPNAGNVIVVGGFGNPGHLTIVDMYVPGSNAFTYPVPTPNDQHEFHTATVLANGKVLVAGGEHDANVVECSSGYGCVVNTMDLYDPTTGFWTAVGPMTTKREFHASALLSNGRVLITGGLAGPDSEDNATIVSSAELY
ncbi:MAG TPA: kelch repeat-containing protein, partial [Rhodocyclaceae bacterium]|nr:kelch repeat-containing protein [Rhodocyclaceae bacterium]